MFGPVAEGTKLPFSAIGTSEHLDKELTPCQAVRLETKEQQIETFAHHFLLKSAPGACSRAVWKCLWSTTTASGSVRFSELLLPTFVAEYFSHGRLVSISDPSSFLWWITHYVLFPLMHIPCLEHATMPNLPIAQTTVEPL